MKRFAHAALLCLAYCLTPPAGAQSLADLQSGLSGNWIFTLEGDQRTRTLAVSEISQKGEGQFNVVGTFGFSSGKGAPLKSGDVRKGPSGTVLEFTADSGAMVSVTAKPDGSFDGASGTFKTANGQTRPVKMAKGEAVAAAAGSTEFDGKWEGWAESGTRECVRGQYALEIKDGKISGTVTFQASLGTAVSLVNGQIRPDKTAVVTLTRQQNYGRGGRFQMAFDKDRATGSDKGTGNCSYDVTLKKG